MICALWASSAAHPVFAQDKQDKSGREEWEGKKVSDIQPVGFKRQRWSDLRLRLNLRKDQPYDKAKRDQDFKSLYQTNAFNDVKIEPTIQANGNVLFTVTVIEFQPIQDIKFTGLNALSLATLKPLLRMNLGDMLNPYLLKLDRDTIREQLMTKGYHFSSVRDEITDSDAGVILVWNIAEGPLVTVKAVEFTGNDHVKADDLKKFMLNKEPQSFLFIPTGGEPFIERYVDEDLKRIKLYYQLEGWLDITQGDRVFVKDLIFSVDRTEVTIRIHIDEGQRYKIKKITFEGVTGNVVKETDLRAALASKVGDFYSDNNSNRDVNKIRELFGEKAYILATAEPETIVSFDKYELDLKYKVVEGQEISVGRIVVLGNVKTRYDVILRELKEFTPGEKYNQQLLTKGIQRLRDRQYFEAGGILVRNEATTVPGVRDVILEVREGSTGQLRFAGGYSSSFGVLGIIEFSQKNFDIADLPHSLSDMFSGNAFAGGGQQLTIRYAPSVGRQSFTINFREPWLFGSEFGLNVRAFNIKTTRESWAEGKVGFTVGVDKRFDPFTVSMAYNWLRYNISNVDSDAPTAVQALSGTNRVVSILTGVTYDTRNSALFPSQGQRLAITYEYAGAPLAGNFDYGKFIFDLEIYRTIYESEGMRAANLLGHIINIDFNFFRADPRGDSVVPFFERFYAGGRDSIRGFDFRGMGPHENGDPVGGDAYGFFSFEYSYPLMVEFLRGAFFYDLACLSPTYADLFHDKWRNTVGFGIRFIIPQLGNIPVALDFGFPLTKRDEDSRQTVTFDIGKLF